MTEQEEYDPYSEAFGEVPAPVPVEVTLLDTDARLPEDLSLHVDPRNPIINGYLENGNSVGVSLSRARKARMFVAGHPKLIAGTAMGVVGGAASLIFLQKQRDKE